MVKECRDEVTKYFTLDGVLTIPPSGPALPCGSGTNTVHYVFDFTQQDQYSHNPLQHGPMYFKTAKKCAVFGVCCDSIPRQINYLIDAASECGKEANSMINLLLHFFIHHITQYISGGFRGGSMGAVAPPFSG